MFIENTILFNIILNIVFLNTGGTAQLLEEPLVKNKGHAADLLHLGLCCGVTVDEICSNGDGQLSPELFPTKS